MKVQQLKLSPAAKLSGSPADLLICMVVLCFKTPFVQGRQV